MRNGREPRRLRAVEALDSHVITESQPRSPQPGEERPNLVAVPAQGLSDGQMSFAAVEEEDEVLFRISVDALTGEDDLVSEDDADLVRAEGVAEPEVEPETAEAEVVAEPAESVVAAEPELAVELLGGVNIGNPERHLGKAVQRHRSTPSFGAQPERRVRWSVLPLDLRHVKIISILRTIHESA